MTRIGDLIPDAARQLGLEDELRLARAIATSWEVRPGEANESAAEVAPDARLVGPQVPATVR